MLQHSNIERLVCYKHFQSSSLIFEGAETLDFIEVHAAKFGFPRAVCADRHLRLTSKLIGPPAGIRLTHDMNNMLFYESFPLHMAAPELVYTQYRSFRHLKLLHDVCRPFLGTRTS